MIVSVIMFKLKEKSDENIAELRQKLLGMEGNIEQLKSIKVEANRRTGPASFDVVMIAKYDSMQDFNEYIAHPFHVGVGKYALDVCEETASVCYEE